MQTPRRARWLYLLAIGLIAISLAACGDDDDDSGSAASDTTEATTREQAPAGGNVSTLDVDATENGGLGFSKQLLTAEAGEVTLSMANPTGNQLPHAIEVEGNGVEEEGETVEAGGTSTVTADLKPGKYVFYCPVGDHRQQGMEGTLTVR